MPITVSQLFIHPIKSAGGIEVAEVELTPRGPAHDRRFMLVEPDGTFVTQRSIGAMAKLQTAITGDSLRVRFEGRPELQIPLMPEGGEPRDVRVWRSTVEARDQGDGVARWFSDALGRELRLVYMADESLRPIREEYAPNGEPVSFADGYPLLVASEASLADLNARMDEPASMRRFRPNVVLRGTQPWQEDRFRSLSVGETSLRVVAPCSRCTITTLDPDTGVRRAPDPLRSLAGFRWHGGEVFFGQNAIPTECGTLRTGDAVKIDAEGEPRPPLANAAPVN